MSICATYHELTASVESLVQGNPKAIATINLYEYFEKLVEWGYIDFKRNFANDRFCGLISDIHFDSATLAIKFTFIIADVKADNQIARNLETNKTRTLRRTSIEGADKRVNVVLKVDRTNKAIAKIALEYERGISVTKLIDTLNYFLGHARKHGGFKDYFIGDDPVERYQKGTKIGQPKPLPYKPKLEIKSEVDPSIIKAFEEGRIQHVDFYKQAQNNIAFDATGHFTQDKIKVSMKVDTRVIDPNSTSKIDDLKDVFRRFKRGQPEMQGSVFTINFKDDNGSPRTAEYDAEDEVFRLVKKEYFPEELRQPMSEDNENGENPARTNIRLCDRMLAKI
jgi:hypothetical protein